jgi:hypothetical protein
MTTIKPMRASVEIMIAKENTVRLQKILSSLLGLKAAVVGFAVQIPQTVFRPNGT